MRCQVCYYFFFFQAEDGIRDAQESRGLGDVYKRQEQTGVTPGRIELLGYFDCRATSHNPDYEAGAATVRPVYLVSAKSIKDLGASSRYERRRMPMNEFAVEIRKRHPEVDSQLQTAINTHMTLFLRGEV